ncbi:MAG: type I methionyl aminopeptidase [Actinobacteria bacterium]|nr:type I methionyl aminopeptidase [Actinomycetota bacterium]MCL6087294.1 type I methionyl aminopeptidase [Actinomycetota bacterium]
MIIYKSEDEIKIMKRAGELVANVLLKLESIIKPGITTEFLDRTAEEIIISRNAKPAFKGYLGRISKIPFPGTICVSVNEEVVHGIPGKRILYEGDLVSIDVGVQLDGFFGDAARSYKVGRAGNKIEKIMQTTWDALNDAIDKCVEGNRLGDISHAIESRAATNGFSVVKDFVGHGIGRNMHEDPQVLNYGPAHQGPLLKKGIVLAIEPMLNEGESDIEVLKDSWTVVTRDGKISCHFEDTVAVTSKGSTILTRL